VQQGRGGGGVQQGRRMGEVLQTRGGGAGLSVCVQCCEGIQPGASDCGFAFIVANFNPLQELLAYTNSNLRHLMALHPSHPALPPLL
jgi:hypothetical protein